jgi:hypothetical protein
MEQSSSSANESYACGELLNLLIHLMLILPHGYRLVTLLWSFYEDSLLCL